MTAGREPAPERRLHAAHRAEPPDPARVDPGAEDGEQRGQDDQRTERGEDRDADAGVRERLQEVDREHQHRGQRGSDRDCRERDRAPGGGHRAGHRFADVALGTELLTEPADHQQRVVHAQTQPEPGREVDREDADAGDMGEHVERGEGGEDRQYGDRQRQQGGDQAAEDEDHQHHRDRYGDRLRDGEVLADLGADIGAPGTADADGHRRVVEVAVVTEQSLRVGVGLLVVADHVGEDQRIGAVARAERGRVRAPVRRDPPQSRVRAQPARECFAGLGRRGVVDRAVPRVHQEDHVRLAAEFLVQQHLRPARGGSRVVEATGEQPAERADAEDDRDQQRKGAQREHESSSGDDLQTPSIEHVNSLSDLMWTALTCHRKWTLSTLRP
jgi:hypothetical protein